MKSEGIEEVEAAVTTPYVNDITTGTLNINAAYIGSAMVIVVLNGLVTARAVTPEEAQAILS